MDEKLKSAITSYESNDLYNCGISMGTLLSEAMLGDQRPIVGSDKKPETLSEA